MFPSELSQLISLSVRGEGFTVAADAVGVGVVDGATVGIVDCATVVAAVVGA